MANIDEKTSFGMWTLEKIQGLFNKQLLVAKSTILGQSNPVDREATVKMFLQVVHDWIADLDICNNRYAPIQF